MSYEKKEERKQEPRVDFFSLTPKSKNLFCGVISILGVFVIFSAVYQKWEDGWLAILDLLGTNVFALFLTVGLVFIIGESILDAYQFFMGKQRERNREIAAEIRNAVARHNTPVRLDELVEKEAFRVLQRQRPKYLFRFYKRKKKQE